MLATYERHAKQKLVATILSVIVIAGAVAIIDRMRAHDNTGSSSLATQTTSRATTTAQPTGTTTGNSNSNTSAAASGSATGTPTATYKNGSYTATSDYFVPHGSETIQVKLTLQNDVITDVSIQNSESDRDSAEYQSQFTASYKTHVVGKKIDGLQLHVIAGASETTQGFNDALVQIASQAHA